MIVVCFSSPWNVLPPILFVSFFQRFHISSQVEMRTIGSICHKFIIFFFFWIYGISLWKINKQLWFFRRRRRCFDLYICACVRSVYWKTSALEPRLGSRIHQKSTTKMNRVRRAHVVRRKVQLIKAHICKDMHSMLHTNTHAHNRKWTQTHMRSSIRHFNRNWSVWV